MPWTGSTFVRDNSAFTGPLAWTDDRDALTKITAAHHDFHDQDLAAGITACLNKNGANSPTANISMNNFKWTNLAAGSSDGDSAAFGQTITAASLDPVTNILTLTRNTGGNVTVDLTALAIGGSTAPFALLAGNQTFTGLNVFSQQMEVKTRITLNSTTAAQSWRFDSPSSTLLTIAANGGCVFNYFSDGAYGVAGGAITIGGYRVWDESRLTTAQVAGLVSASSAQTITGAWIFSNPSTKLFNHLEAGSTGGNWTIGPDSGTQYSWNDPTSLHGMAYIIDATFTSGAYLQVGPSKVWDRGSMKIVASGVPTGGLDDDLAVVKTGGSKGLWCKISGVWTLIAS